MAGEKVTIRYMKSPHWRIAYATGAAIGAMTGPTGTQLSFRFTTEWADIDREEFDAEVKGGTVSAKGPSTVSLGPLIKMEEVSVTMPPDGMGNLVAAILGQWQHFSPQTQQKIRDAVAKLPKPVSVS